MKQIKKFTALLCAASLALGLSACGSAPAQQATDTQGTEPNTQASSTYKIGLCNYVDDASLNQICDSIKSRLAEIEAEKGVKFEVSFDNANADSNVLNQIVAGFEADKVDLMVGVATPVAMAMQAATEQSGTPVVFSAVSDPVGVGLVADMQAPGANLTGTSDAFDTTKLMELMLTAQPDVKKVGLLYDVGQDSSTAAIIAAKDFLDKKGLSYVDRTGTTIDEVQLAADALVADGVDAVFTPTDNTIMTAELSIYEKFSKAGIGHYAGADSFALNGAFVGYGVDYVELGKQTADMVAEILLDGKKPAETAVKTFDNGLVTVNTEVCTALGLDYATLEKTLAPMASKVKPIQTAESFS